MDKAFDEEKRDEFCSNVSCCCFECSGTCDHSLVLEASSSTFAFSVNEKRNRIS